MDFGLSQDQQDIQRTARELLAARAGAARVREHAEDERTDTELWRELCELGWPGIAIGEEHGGQGLGAIEQAILCEELGRTYAPVPYLPSVLAATFVAHAGSDAQRAEHLPGLASGKTIGAVAETRDGEAALVAGGEDAQLFVLLEDGAARLVPRAEATIEPAPSVDPTRPSASVRATGGEELAGDVATAIDHALVAIAAELVGVCDAALEMTVAYVKERKQFGTPVGAYQAISHKCAGMLMATEQARAATTFAAYIASAEPERLPEAAAMAKAAASSAGRTVTGAAIQAHGGIGFTWEADVHWLFKRAQIDAALLGGAGRHSTRVAGLAGAAQPVSA